MRYTQKNYKVKPLLLQNYWVRDYLAQGILEEKQGDFSAT
jgi:hypothetical protein